MAAPDNQNFDWYAVEKYRGYQPSPYVSTIRFWTMMDAQRGKVGHAWIFRHAHNPYTIPPTSTEYEAVEIVLDTVFAQFWFICQTSPLGAN